MISKINWTALKETKADGQKHQLGETIYKHIQADKTTHETITARLHDSIFVCHKINGNWGIPIRLYVSEDTKTNKKTLVTIPED